MKALKQAMGMVAMAGMMEAFKEPRFDPDVRYDLSMRKKDPNKAKPDAKKIRKRKLQKAARKINRR